MINTVNIFLLSALSFASALPVQKEADRGRIIGGSPAYEGQFPFSAAIYITKSNGKYFCGGALFTNQWIITAGQCVFEATLFTIQLGSIYLNKDDANRQLVATNEYEVHPEYVPVLENDVGLIHVRLPVQFNTYLRPIDYLTTEDFSYNYYYSASGWGHISDEEGELVDILEYTYLRAISDEQCRAYYGNQMVEHMVCVAGTFNEGICTGDTGSAMTQYRNGQISFHVGIASFFSYNGCDTRDPSGFTKTYPYVGWINSAINGTKYNNTYIKNNK